MRVALMGAGSLGTIIGALAAKNGEDITLIDTNKEHIRALNENGATIVGKTEVNIPVTAITPDEMTGIYDIVLYLVKQTHNETALNQLLPHLSQDSVVCTLQNGVPENAVAELIGKERTIGGTVGWGATWEKPGVSRLTSETDKMTYDVGEIDGKRTERVDNVVEILNKTGQAYVTENLMGHRWVKLLVNATLSGMSASLGCTFGEVLDNKKALECVGHIGNEIIKVSRAMGIQLEPIQGHDLSILSFDSREEMEKKLPIYHKVFQPHRELKASMLQDLEKNQKTEVDGLNGVVSQMGRKYNVKTPLNDQVVKIIKDIEAGNLKHQFSNLDLFELPDIS
ncbi:ketopantoate reductase family protein [Natranaerofaba carboxydovora]|uniref:ketopantoate reductase family protein n=1 Tax=Natranaerofaba carboxydovora TaxID=2742683 RepID=UPI001F1419AE|nr:2-dehydropantoate 2-reductase [Natranaerofaba carboxydovora]UMZ74229.1 hypothetical protein ACONDI_01815 [Natranaerofaba carboxydovora]